MAIAIAPEEKTILKSLARYDSQWKELEERYEDITPPGVTCFTRAREAFAPDYKVLSEDSTYWARQGQGVKRDMALAKAIGFFGYPRGIEDRLAFVKTPREDSDGELEGLILVIPESIGGGETLPYFCNLLGKTSTPEAIKILRKYDRLKQETILGIESALETYVGEEDPRKWAISPEGEERLNLKVVSEKGIFDSRLWFLMGALENRFLRYSNVWFGKNMIMFGEWQDCSGSEAPGYRLAYRIDGSKPYNMSTGGDYATAQKVLLDVCGDMKKLGIPLLPTVAKLDELD